MNLPKLLSPWKHSYVKRSKNWTDNCSKRQTAFKSFYSFPITRIRLTVIQKGHLSINYFHRKLSSNSGITMGSAASWGNREQTSPDTAEALISHEEWERQGREMLSRLRIIPPVQRRRAESVGYPTQNGIYWVYWRPKEARQQAAGGKTGNQGVITFEQNKKTD